MNHERIKLTDSTADILFKMSDGNPGAITALMEILKNGAEIDPMLGAMGVLMPILTLDTIGIYGTEIYILWNKQCNRDVRELLMLLRANQLGFISSERIKAVAADQMREVIFTPEEMDDFNTKVCAESDTFKKRIAV